VKAALLALFASVAVSVATDPFATKGAELFSDDFERSDAGKWTFSKGLSVADGVMRGGQALGKHGAIGASEVPMKRDVIIEFKFRFEGAASINAVLDDKAYTGSHAGHLCRATITPKLIRLGDDKEGGMRNDIYAMRQDPARKAEGDKLLAGRTQSFPQKIEASRWYQLRIEMVGDEMRVSLDGKLVGSLKSPGIAHPTKSRFHFTVNGKDALFDDVRIWSAAAK
jgi:hypothetical protein